MNKKLGFCFDYSYLSLPPCFYSMIEVEPITNPTLIILNSDLMKSLHLNVENISELELADFFVGKSVNKTRCFAQAYMGHQYGHLNMLGDGRAVMLGEHVLENGVRFDIQLKGSGVTPYSRQGDGRAALGPMLREYIISEAMYHLGIPTTRSLAVLTTGEKIQREELLTGAILVRVAQSHLRFGTFEFAALQYDKYILEALLDYAINRHYPELKQSPNKALEFLNKVMHKQIDLLVNWMRVGFIHGVMNTDNMTISGETIDYGPCALMDSYDPNTVFSSIDKHGRYAFANQAPILQWNLARLAETLLPLIAEDEKNAIKQAEILINEFPTIYKSKWLSMMRSKLGLLGEDKDDLNLINELLQWMHDNHADYTNTFNYLGNRIVSDDLNPYQQEAFNNWHEKWKKRLKKNNQTLQQAYKMMHQINPVVIPRNHQVEKVLQNAEDGNLKPLENLLTVLKDPYHYDLSFSDYYFPPKPEEKVYQTFCGT